MRKRECEKENIDRINVANCWNTSKDLWNYFTFQLTYILKSFRFVRTGFKKKKSATNLLYKLKREKKK